MTTTLETIDAQLDAWTAVIDNARQHIGELVVAKVHAAAALRHPAAHVLHLHHDAAGYFLTGLFDTDGRDLLDGADPALELTAAINQLPSGTVAYSRADDAHRMELPGGPDRCTACGYTVDEDDSYPDGTYSHHQSD